MKPTFEYQGYLGSAEVSIEDNVVHGKLLYISDVVGYVADAPKDLEAAFRAAVDDYLETCAECGDTPDVPFKGTFNVRLGPDLHRQCALAAERDDMKLNEWVKVACQTHLGAQCTVQHNHVHLHIDEPVTMSTAQPLIAPRSFWSQHATTQH